MLDDQDVDIREVKRLIQPSDGIVIGVGADEGEVARRFARPGLMVIAYDRPRGMLERSLYPVSVTL